MLRTLFRMLRPRDADRAAVIKHRLALVYAVTGWHAAIYVFYLAYVGEGGLKNQRETILQRAVDSGNTVDLITLTGFNVTDMKRERISEAKPSKE